MRTFHWTTSPRIIEQSFIGYPYVKWDTILSIHLNNLVPPDTKNLDCVVNVNTVGEIFRICSILPKNFIYGSCPFESIVY